jgi:hypothetical protein
MTSLWVLTYQILLHHWSFLLMISPTAGNHDDDDGLGVQSVVDGKYNRLDLQSKLPFILAEEALRHGNPELIDSLREDRQAFRSEEQGSRRHLRPRPRCELVWPIQGF